MSKSLPSGPPASWCAVRGSPEFRAYQSLPRHQDYFEIPRSELVVPNSKKSSRDEEESDDVFVEESSNDVAAIKSDSLDDDDVNKKIESTHSHSASNLQLIGHDNSGGTPARISQIKPPRIHAKFNFSPQSNAKSSERKSSIPILRRSSKEFEDIRSPIESAKRSLIPQR